MGIKEKLKHTELYEIYFFHLQNIRYERDLKKHGPEYLIKKEWKSIFNYDLDLNNPKTLNEKMQWLKLYAFEPIHTVWADKYKCREYIKEHFGEEYLVPLYFHTDKISDINPNNIKEFPCVVKANHSSKSYKLFRTPEDVNFRKLRRSCKRWINQDYYARTLEKQYKDIKRCIIVEKMLLTKEGKIPNDYKLHFIEGKLVFTYCSVDREGDNYRQIFDKDWNLLPFSWGDESASKKEHPPIAKPKTYEKMVEIGEHFAKQTHYVRVDFYDVDGKLYCGEITLHHGGGKDKFSPPEYDLKYGEMVKLPIKK